MKHISLVLLFIFAGYFVVGQINGIKVIGDTCDSFTLTLQATGTSSSPYFFWNFGDPASGSADTVTITGASLISAPTHVFSGPGVYNVCVSLQEPNSLVTTVCRTFFLGLCCSGVINSNDSCRENGTSFTFTSGGSVNSVSWDFGDPASGAANVSTSLNPVHTFSDTGTYSITATATAACGVFTSNFTKRVINCLPPPVCTGSVSATDSCLVSGASFSLQSLAAVSVVQWNFGDVGSGLNNTSGLLNPLHRYSTAGTYTITATGTAACGNFSQSFLFTVVDCTPPVCNGNIVVSDTCLAAGSAFTVQSASAINSVQWNFGDPATGAANTSASISPAHLFSATGNYIVTAVATLSCGTDTITKNITVTMCDTAFNSNCRPVLPSSFTPNGDTRNDLFGPLLPCAYQAYQLLIFNRWGQLVYMTTNPAQKWNGTFKGANSGVGAYIYAVIYKDGGGIKRVQKGTVLLLR